MPSTLEVVLDIAIATITTSYFAVKFLLKKQADIYFAKNLERFRSELQLIAKQVEFDHTRKTVAFNLFFQKKHDSYFKFYDLITEANGLVHSLYGLRREKPIETMVIQDIAATMKLRGVSPATISEYMRRISGEGIDAVKDDLGKFMRSIEFEKAEMACREAKNHLILSRLYFDNALFDMSSKMCNELLYLHIEYRSGFEMPGSGNKEMQEQHIASFDNLFMEVLKRMQSELGVGYFEAKEGETVDT